MQRNKCGKRFCYLVASSVGGRGRKDSSYCCLIKRISMKFFPATAMSKLHHHKPQFAVLAWGTIELVGNVQIHDRCNDGVHGKASVLHHVAWQQAGLLSMRHINMLSQLPSRRNRYTCSQAGVRRKGRDCSPSHLLPADKPRAMPVLHSIQVGMSLQFRHHAALGSDVSFCHVTCYCRG